MDRPNALPLPERPYEYAEWCKAKVNIDYHIEVDHHYYSVPFRLLRERLDVRLTATIVEAFHKGERVAAHARSYVRGSHTTLNSHVERAHRTHTEEFYEVYDGDLYIPALGRALRAWEHTYNHIRPHQALDGRTPLEYLMECHPEPALSLPKGLAPKGQLSHM